MYLLHSDDEATVIDHGPHWSARPMTTQGDALALDTECVAPLPMSSLRPDWQIWLATTWARFAVPFCGAAAGLILILSYLALGSEKHAVAASVSAASSSAIVMRVDGPAPTDRDAAVRHAIAMARSGATAPSATPMVDIEEAATTGTIVAAEPDEIEMDAVPMQRPAKHVVRKRPTHGATKRGPITLNAATALGDLRVNRSR